MAGGQIQIKPKDDGFEITINDLVFTVSRHDCGLQQLPEEVRQKLPHYFPEMLEKLINAWDGDERHHIAIMHRQWCSELKGTGMCNCDAIIDEPLTGDVEKIACHVCGTFSSGPAKMNRYKLESDSYLRLYRPEYSEMVYWGLKEEEGGKILCNDCFSRAFNEIALQSLDQILLLDPNCSDALH